MSEPTVFISYSHDDDDHRERVLGLSERLRRDGFDSRLDQYISGSPTQGWPRWMLDQLDEADWVLVVCTETYYRRYRGHEEPDKGKGVDFEGLMITLDLYNDRSQNTRFIPVLFDAADAEFIPEPLRAWSYFALTSKLAYSKLLDVLRHVDGVEPGEIGTQPPGQRRTGVLLTCDDVPGPPPAGAATSTALTTWREKREFLITELALAQGASKFALQKQLEEADEWIARLERGG